MFFVLEMIGTIAFAISGAFVGIQKKMDLFGVTILAMTTAVGGGIVRDIIQLLSIELIILVFTFGFSGFSNVDVSKFLAIVLSVAFVYVGVVVIMYLLDFRTAKKMTDDLKAFQKSNN